MSATKQCESRPSDASKRRVRLATLDPIEGSEYALAEVVGWDDEIRDPYLIHLPTYYAQTDGHGCWRPGDRR